MDGEFTTQQATFLKHYLDPLSETFDNAYQSALRAGYSKEYAEVITDKDLKWLSESVGDGKMLQKAEKNLNKALDIPVENEKIGGRAIDVSKFVAERIGKNKWNEKKELEVKGQLELKSLEQEIKSLTSNQ